jgi:hypothetical protein
MFLGLPDPDPLVRGMDPDPSTIKQKKTKKTKKNIHSSCFLIFLKTFYLFKNYINVSSKNNKQKNLVRKILSCLLEGH